MKFVSILQLDQIKLLVKALLDKNIFFAVDLETTGLNPRTSEIIGVGLSFDPSMALYIPIAHVYDQPFDGREALSILRPLFEKNSFCAYNALFEIEFLKHQAKFLIDPVKIIDAQLLVYVSAEFERLKLSHVAHSALGMEVWDFEDFMERQELKKKPISYAPVSAVTEYCGRDALATYLLCKKYWPKYKDNFIFKLESAVLPVVLFMKENGILVDLEFLKSEAVRVLSYRDAVYKFIQDELESIVGEKLEFNVGSSQQTGDILYNKLHLLCDVSTEKGAKSTNEQALFRIQEKSSVVKNILVWRGLNTLLNKYLLKKLPTSLDFDGRIRAGFNQSGAITGRFSCARPNLQNIPNEAEFTAVEFPSKKLFKIKCNVRFGFKVPKDGWFIEFDYNQIEARLAAGVTQEYALLDAFAKGIDYHTKTASILFGISPENVTKEKRQIGKTMNFALFYGGGVRVVYDAMKKIFPGVTWDECKMFRNKYITGYSKMFSVAEKISDQAQKVEFVQTHFGRVIPIFEFRSSDVAMIARGRRVAFNGVIQGTAADIMKMALVRIYALLCKKDWLKKVKLLAQIHDAAAFETLDGLNLYDFCSYVLETMATKIDGFPNIYASVKLGKSWGDLKEQNKNESLLDFLRRVTSFDFEASSLMGKEFILDLQEKPPLNNVEKFKSMLMAFPGTNQIFLKVKDVIKPIPWKTSLGLADKDKILFFMKGAFYEKDFSLSII